MDAGNRIKVVIDNGAYEPQRAHENDAGFDLRSPIEIRVDAGESVTIDSGVHVAIPKGYVGMLKSKSGLNVRYGLQSEGVIDCGYTGSIVIKIHNHGKENILIEKGDKISQLVILPIVTPEIEVVSELEETERGDNGFGSTGR